MQIFGANTSNLNKSLLKMIIIINYCTPYNCLQNTEAGIK